MSKEWFPLIDEDKCIGLPATTNASMAFMMLRTAVRWLCTVKDVLTGVMVAETYARKVQLSIRVNIRNTSNAVAVVVTKTLLPEKRKTSGRWRIC